MSSTTFVDFSPATPIVAAWLNDVNKDVYTPVANVAAVRLLSKTGPCKATTLGYTTAGDGGAATYILNLADTTSADNGGSIIVGVDGGRWYLTSDYTVTSKMFGCKMDGTSDDSVAFQAAVNYAIANRRGLQVSGGTMALSAQIVGVGPLALSGEGMGQTSFKWPAGSLAANSGFNLTTTADGNGLVQTITLRDFTITTGALGVGTAILITCPNAQSADRVTERVNMQNIAMRGNTNPLVDGWFEGVEFRNCQGTYVNNCTFWGYQTTQTNFVSSIAFNFNNVNGASPHPTQYTIENCYISGVITGILMSDFEGGIIRGNQIFSTVNGINITAPSLNYPHILITGNYVNATTVAISVGWMYEVFITDNLIYGQLVEGTVSTGVSMISGASYFTIQNNIFENFKNSTAMNGIVLSSGSDFGSIGGNVFRRTDSIDTTAHGVGIWLTAGANANKVARNNVFSLTTTPILNSGSSNGVAMRVVGSNSTWHEDEDGYVEAFGSVALTLTGAGSGSVTFPNTNFAAAPQVMAMNGDFTSTPGGIVSIGTVNTTGFVFNVSPNPGAVSFRVNWTAKGQAV